MSPNPSRDARTNSPLNRPIDALRRFQTRCELTFSPDELETINEIETRLQRLANEYQELLDINDRLMNTDPLRIRTSIDPWSGVVSFDVGSEAFHFKLNRADPQLPILKSHETAVGAYRSGSSSEEAEEVVQLKARMETLLEGFYQNAHRVQKLVKTLSGIPGKESRKITIVRNKLVEHPDVGEPYTFGWSTNGPVVRPLHRRPDRKWADPGLVPNTQEFADVLTRAFET